MSTAWRCKGRRNVAVEIQRCADTSMAQHVGHHLRMDTFAKEQGGGCVPELSPPPSLQFAVVDVSWSALATPDLLLKANISATRAR